MESQPTPLSAEVKAICAKHFPACGGCPIYEPCHLFPSGRLTLVAISTHSENVNRAALAVTN